MLSHTEFFIKLFFIGVWLPRGNKSLVVLPSRVNPGYLHLSITTWMVLVVCLSICGWHVVGKCKAELYNFWWSLPVCTCLSQLLNMRNCDWNSIRFSDYSTLLTILIGSFTPAHSAYIASRDLPIIISTKSHSFYSASILTLWSVEGFSSILPSKLLRSR